MENGQKEIKICTRHEKEIPLVWTFAFQGAEYWCPYCGFTGGMFGSGKNVPLTEELKQAQVEWEAKGKEFLDARSTLICDETEWNGKRIKPSELPKEEIERLRKIVDEFKYSDKE